MNIEWLFIIYLFLSWIILENLDELDIDLFSNSETNLLENLESIIWRHKNKDSSIKKENFSIEDIVKIENFFMDYIILNKEKINKPEAIRIIFERYNLNIKILNKPICTIYSEYFKNRNDMIDWIIILFFLKNIIIKSFSARNDEESDIIDIWYWLVFTESFLNTFQKYLEISNNLFEKVIDEQYSSIKLNKTKSWDIILNLWIGNNQINNKIVDIVKTFPFSDINLKVHNWKITICNITKKEKILS